MESFSAPTIRNAPARNPVPVPENLRADAFTVNGTRRNHWEKSLVVLFPERRLTLSTSDGLVNALAAVNHSAHPRLWEIVGQEFGEQDGCGGKLYIEHIRDKLADDLCFDSPSITTIATAVDITNLAVVTRTFAPITVTAIVTAGVETNALRAGTDTGTYLEGRDPAPGTINIVLLTNVMLTVGAMARAIVTATEAKTAALQDLRVPSSYTPHVQATGTGTDSVIVVSGTESPPFTYTGGHSRIGGMIGQAVREGVMTALARHLAAQARGTFDAAAGA